MKINVAEKRAAITTHEGGPATHAPNASAELRRAVMACLLWEDQFYESGEDIAERIKRLVLLSPPETVVEFAIRAREDMKLRHVPLMMVAAMATPTLTLQHHSRYVASTLERIVQRADELSEFIAIYAKVWGYQPKEIRKHLSAQVKKGLARAFVKFGEHALAKYDREGAVRLRDVLFLSHAKPKDAPLRRYTKAEREAERKNELVRRAPMSADEQLLLRVVEEKLATPDTWEVELSGGADKAETFARLIAEDKLGALALLRNLRNMAESGVDTGLVKMALEKMDVTRVLPHRFIAAARYAPQWEHWIEPKMLECCATMPKLKGSTMLLVDVSGSMDHPMSGKSDLRRVDAACGLAIIAREVCEDVAVVTFSGATVAVPPRRGFALRDAIIKSQPHGSTLLGNALQAVKGAPHDRIIVITDEQSADKVGPPRAGAKGYMINVASNENGVGYGAWNKIDGFSEAVVRYIAEYEQGDEQ